MISICEESEKGEKLQELLQTIYEQDANPGKILIFAQTKRGVDQIARFIQNFGVKCCAIHGDKSQTDRDYTLKSFRSGRVNILVVNIQIFVELVQSQTIFSLMNRLQMWQLEA